MVLAGFVGGFGWFWMVLGRFGWFRVLVTTCVQVTIRVAAVIEAVIANTCSLIRAFKASTLIILLHTCCLKIVQYC